MTTERYFSTDYITARQRFRDDVATSGGRLDSLRLAATGPQGEDLTIDVAWFGSEKPRRVLVHSSGLHGVEAFAGSAIQLRWLAEGIRPLPKGAAIVLVHVLNPYGMAWFRRFNENNVDLNRNFLAPNEKFAGAPEGYLIMDKFLNPPTPPNRDLFYLRAAWLMARYRMETLKQAIAGGQYVNSKGLFFGGKHLEQGPMKFQEYMASKLANVERIVAIDIHTGLGKFSDDRLLVDASPERASVSETMQAVFGERVQAMDTHGVAYEARGAQHNMYYSLFSEAKTYFATQEFGTYHGVRVVKALRAENRWHHYGAGTINHTTKTKLREMFNPAAEEWRVSVLKRGQEVIQQALILAFDSDVRRGRYSLRSVYGGSSRDLQDI
jgi:hypothetical protein